MLNRYHSAVNSSEKETTRTGPFSTLMLPKCPLWVLVPIHLPTPATAEALSHPTPTPTAPQHCRLLTSDRWRMVYFQACTSYLKWLWLSFHVSKLCIIAFLSLFIWFGHFLKGWAGGLSSSFLFTYLGRVSFIGDLSCRYFSPVWFFSLDFAHSAFCRRQSHFYEVNFPVFPFMVSGLSCTQ